MAAYSHIDPLQHLSLTASRRLEVRYDLPSISYVHVDDDNGGVILNICEGGVSLQAVHPLVDNRFLRLKFKLPDSGISVKVNGQVVWLSQSKTHAGVCFVDLPETVRAEIRGLGFIGHCGTQNGRTRPPRRCGWQADPAIQTGNSTAPRDQRHCAAVTISRSYYPGLAVTRSPTVRLVRQITLQNLFTAVTTRIYRTRPIRVADRAAFTQFAKTRDNALYPAQIQTNLQAKMRRSVDVARFLESSNGS